MCLFDCATLQVFSGDEYSNILSYLILLYFVLSDILSHVNVSYTFFVITFVRKSETVDFMLFPRLRTQFKCVETNKRANEFQYR